MFQEILHKQHNLHNHVRDVTELGNSWHTCISECVRSLHSRTYT